MDLMQWVSNTKNNSEKQSGEYNYSGVELAGCKVWVAWLKFKFDRAIENFIRVPKFFFKKKLERKSK